MKAKLIKYLKIIVCFVFFSMISLAVTVFSASAISAYFAPVMFKAVGLNYESKMIDIIVFGLFPLGFLYLMGAVGLCVLLYTLWKKLKVIYIDK